MNKLKAHIFDLDGTLVDSMGLWVDIDHAVLADRGIPMPSNYDEYVEAIIPLNPTESAAYAIKFFGLTDTVEEIVQEWYNRAKETYSRTIPLKPGAYKFLHNLKAEGVKMAVATSSPKNLCEVSLKNHGIEELFDAICLSEEVGCGKDKPDVFLLAAKRLGVLPKDCIVYEDSLVAVKTAKSLGMTVCAVYDDASAKNWEEIKGLADYTIGNWKEIRGPADYTTDKKEALNVNI